MIDIVAHTMEYNCGLLESNITLEQYSDKYFHEYKRIYEDCFHEMRTTLGLYPVNDCDSREELLKKANDIFLYIEDNVLIGSIAIYGNEIDDLIVAKKYQRNGYGLLLLNFAITKMQKNNVSKIMLNVADWNKAAINLYLKNGFHITKTETIKRSK